MCGVTVEVLETDTSLYAYLCQGCDEYFICPAWKDAIWGEQEKGKLAICPYCKANDIIALHTDLPLSITNN